MVRKLRHRDHRPWRPVAVALAVAQAAVWALRPRSGLVAAVPVDVREHFSEAEVAKARAYRRGQLAIFAASTAVETAALAALARGVGPRLPRRPAVAGAGLSAGPGPAAPPLA